MENGNFGTYDGDNDRVFWAIFLTVINVVLAFLIGIGVVFTAIVSLVIYILINEDISTAEHYTWHNIRVDKQ